jgi:hypothetical protein
VSWQAFATAGSDAVLAAAALFLMSRRARGAPLRALGLLLVGSAAVVGVFHYLGLGAFTEPHRVLSRIAALSALPLIALAETLPEDRRLTGRPAAVAFAIFLVLAGGAALAARLDFWPAAVNLAALIGLGWARRRAGWAAVAGLPVLAFALARADEPIAFHSLFALALLLLFGRRG